MSRNKKDLKKAIKDIQILRSDFYNSIKVTGEKYSFNESLAKALRVADFMELGELFALDALNRNESCGGHFREEYQTKEGEALRNDDDYRFVSAWEYNPIIEFSKLHKEHLNFENVELKSRSYK
jgi:succinate dehydrogenase / fumarate reductase flavoprotein subunit